MVSQRQWLARGELALLTLPDGRMLRGHGFEQPGLPAPDKTN